MCAQYRMLRDYTSRKYVGPRIGDKVLLGLIIMSLYWHAAKDVDNPYKVPNVAAVLFMASILPGFTASSYMPALVLERPLYYRQALRLDKASNNNIWFGVFPPVHLV